VSRLLLVDGNPLIWRSFSMFEGLQTKSGQDTGCLFGALEKLAKAIGVTQPSAMTVCWDVGRSRWRKARYSGYKSSRDHKFTTPVEQASFESAYEQMNIMKQVLEVAGVHQVGVQGVEADDLLGLLSSGFNQLGTYDEVVICSDDHDMHQLISGRVKIFAPAHSKTKKPHYVTEEDVREEWNGFGPQSLIEIKSLTGDGGDDIPGIKGVGPKRATELLKQFGSLEALFKPENAPLLAKKTWSFPLTYLGAKEIVERATALVTIPTVEDFPQFNQEELNSLALELSKTVAGDRFQLAGLCEQYELRKALQKLDLLSVPAPSFAGFEKWFPSLLQAKPSE
jgi:5'-3' exonuclease